MSKVKSEVSQEGFLVKVGMSIAKTLIAKTVGAIYRKALRTYISDSLSPDLTGQLKIAFLNRNLSQIINDAKKSDLSPYVSGQNLATYFIYDNKQLTNRKDIEKAIDSTISEVKQLPKILDKWISEILVKDVKAGSTEFILEELGKSFEKLLPKGALDQYSLNGPADEIKELEGCSDPATYGVKIRNNLHHFITMNNKLELMVEGKHPLIRPIYKELDKKAVGVLKELQKVWFALLNRRFVFIYKAVEWLGRSTFNAIKNPKALESLETVFVELEEISDIELMDSMSRHQLLIMDNYPSLEDELFSLSQLVDKENHPRYLIAQFSQEGFFDNIKKFFKDEKKEELAEEEDNVKFVEKYLKTLNSLSFTEQEGGLVLSQYGRLFAFGDKLLKSPEELIQYFDKHLKQQRVIFKALDEFANNAKKQYDQDLAVFKKRAGESEEEYNNNPLYFPNKNTLESFAKALGFKYQPNKQDEVPVLNGKFVVWNYYPVYDDTPILSSIKSFENKIEGNSQRLNKNTFETLRKQLGELGQLYLEFNKIAGKGFLVDDYRLEQVLSPHFDDDNSHAHTTFEEGYGADARSFGHYFMNEIFNVDYNADIFKETLKLLKDHSGSVSTESIEVSQEGFFKNIANRFFRGEKSKREERGIEWFMGIDSFEKQVAKQIIKLRSAKPIESEKKTRASQYGRLFYTTGGKTVNSPEALVTAVKGEVALLRKLLDANKTFVKDCWTDYKAIISDLEKAGKAGKPIPAFTFPSEKTLNKHKSTMGVDNRGQLKHPLGGMVSEIEYKVTRRSFIARPGTAKKQPGPDVPDPVHYAGKQFDTLVKLSAEIWEIWKDGFLLFDDAWGEPYQEMLADRVGNYYHTEPTYKALDDMADAVLRTIADLAYATFGSIIELSHLNDYLLDSAGIVELEEIEDLLSLSLEDETSSEVQEGEENHESSEEDSDDDSEDENQTETSSDTEELNQTGEEESGETPEEGRPEREETTRRDTTPRRHEAEVDSPEAIKAAIKGYLEPLVGDIVSSLKLYSASEVNRPLYHVSMNNNIPYFTPQVSKRTLSNEDRSIPRISTSTCLIGCLNGYQSLMSDIEGRQKKNFSGVYTVYQLPYQFAVKPTKQLVSDVDYSDEYWLVSWKKETYRTVPVKAAKFTIPKIEKVFGKDSNDETYHCYIKVNESDFYLNHHLKLDKGYYSVLLKGYHYRYPLDNIAQVEVQTISERDYHLVTALSMTINTR